VKVCAAQSCAAARATVAAERSVERIMLVEGVTKRVKWIDYNKRVCKWIGKVEGRYEDANLERNVIAKRGRTGHYKE
jgi:hypothetical protein